MEDKIIDEDRRCFLMSEKYISLAIKANRANKPRQFARLMSKSSFASGKAVGLLDALNIMGEVKRNA